MSAMKILHEYIIVGSGPSGSQAAQTLIEAGANVTMLDVGFNNKAYKDIIPDDTFVSLRKTDRSQHRYFLGDTFEGISLGKTTLGPQLTSPRNFITRDTEKYSPLHSSTFSAMESLAYGGLGSGWGLDCYVFSKEEIKKVGLDNEAMIKAYKKISKRIGISAAIDDTSDYTTGSIRCFQPPLKIDDTCRALYELYNARKKSLNDMGIFMGQPPMAMLTEDKGDRQKTSYSDMDFYSDSGRSAYRPWMTVEYLKKKKNFRYIRNTLVIHFEENSGSIVVNTVHLPIGEKRQYRCKTLILACGTLGTARIVLRSLKKDQVKLPLLCNHYCYIPMLLLKKLGTSTERHRTSLSQLVMFYDENKKNENATMASLYSYRSLLLHQLVKKIPLNVSDGRHIMQFLQSGLVIAGIHHPENTSTKKNISLKKDKRSYTGDALHVEYQLSKEELKITRRNEKKYIQAFLKLSCLPLPRIYPGYGSSIHYAGTLPFNDEEGLYTLHPSGLLNGTKNIYVADGSGFRFLPAKGLTFSLMANAHIVATNLLHNQ